MKFFDTFRRILGGWPDAYLYISCSIPQIVNVRMASSAEVELHFSKGVSQDPDDNFAVLMGRAASTIKRLRGGNAHATMHRPLASHISNTRAINASQAAHASKHKHAAAADIRRCEIYIYIFFTHSRGEQRPERACIYAAHWHTFRKFTFAAAAPLIWVPLGLLAPRSFSLFLSLEWVWCSLYSLSCGTHPRTCMIFWWPLAFCLALRGCASVNLNVHHIIYITLWDWI